MNIDSVIGEGNSTKGKLKQSIGQATGDQKLQADGTFDQVAGEARKAFGAVRDFAREQPLKTAAVAGAIGIALLGTLRGRPVAASRKAR